MNKVKSKSITIPILQKKLDGLFSEYIRLRDANDNGFCKCVTCGDMWSWRFMQNGHYIDRRHIATRYDERNCNSQCKNCNVGLRGNIERYKRAIISKYGVKVLEELDAAKNTTVHMTHADYQEKISYYKTEVEKLKEENDVC